MQKTKLKANAVKSLTDARYFAAREVEWIGFRLMGAPEDVISINAAKAIAEWVDGVKIIGEFEFANADEIIEAHKIFPFDAIQVGTFFPNEELEKLNGHTIIKEIIIESDSTEAAIEMQLKDASPYCHYFLLDFIKTGINWAKILLDGNPISIPFIKTITSSYKVILSLDFSAETVEQIVDTLAPAGLALSGDDEEKIGFKSFDELDEILDVLMQPNQ